MKVFSVAGAVVVLTSMTAVAPAGEVTMKGTHLCCQSCQDAVEGVLGEAEGVTEVKIDRKQKLITFTAADADKAQGAVTKLAEAGFAGNAEHAGTKLKLTKIGVKKGEKANELTLTDVHLCCGACAVAVQATLKKVEGVSEVKVDRDAGTVVVTGTDIDLRAAFRELRKAGFNGKRKQ